MDKHSHKLSEEDVFLICELIKEQQKLKKKWMQLSNQNIAQKFGVSTSCISYIKQNRIKTNDF